MEIFNLKNCALKKNIEGKKRQVGKYKKVGKQWREEQNPKNWKNWKAQRDYIANQYRVRVRRGSEVSGINTRSVFGSNYSLDTIHGTVRSGGSC